MPACQIIKTNQIVLIDAYSTFHIIIVYKVKFWA